MDNILFPTDYSETAFNALGYTCEIALKTGSKITLLNVYDIPMVDANIALDLLASIEKELNKQNLEKLQELSGELHEKHGEKFKEIKFDYRAAHGFTVEEILVAADDTQADMIIMGTTGAGGVKEYVMGSNTEKIIDSAHCPVLAIPSGAMYSSIRKIVYASDLAKGDRLAISQLSEIAEIFNAHIRIIHLKKKDGPDDYAEYKLNMKKIVDLTTFYDKIDFDYLVLDDGMEEGLDNYLKEEQADILAMLSKKRNFFQRLFTSDLTQKMAFHTKFPLLVFHE